MVHIFNICLLLCVLSGGVFAIILGSSKNSVGCVRTFRDVEFSLSRTDYIKVCKRDQNTINECVRDSIDNLRPYLIKGIPELNVPSLEPFYIPEIVAVSGDLLPLKASGKDVKVSGTGNFSIKSVDVDLETLTIHAKVRFPRLHLDGRYSLDTQILIVPLRGEGKLHADVVKCDADILLKSQVYQKNGVDYIKFTSLTIESKIKDYRLKLDGLFNGNKALGDATNEAIDQNRGEFWKTIQPYIEKSVSKVLLDSANKIVSEFPLDELLVKN